MEAVINSIISLILIVPLDNNEGLVTALCEKLSKTQPGDKRNSARLRLHNNLFHGIDERSTHRYIVFCSLLKLAGRVDLMNLVNPELDDVSRHTHTHTHTHTHHGDEHDCLDTILSRLFCEWISELG